MCGLRILHEGLEVLVKIRNSDEPLTRSEISRALGLSFRDVEPLLSALITSGLIVSQGTPPSYMLARSSSPVVPDRRSRSPLGQDFRKALDEALGADQGAESLNSSDFALLGSRTEDEDVFDAFFALMTFAGGVSMSVIAERMQGGPVPKEFHGALRNVELGDLGPGYVSTIRRMQYSDPVAAFRVFFAELAERDQDILRNRLRVDSESLEDIAVRHQMSREAVRQVVTRIRHDFERLAFEPPARERGFLLYERIQLAKSNMPQILDIRALERALRPVLPMIRYLPLELRQPFFFLMFGQKSSKSALGASDVPNGFVQFGDELFWFVEAGILNALIGVRDCAIKVGMPTVDAFAAVPALRELNDLQAFLSACGLVEVDGEITKRGLSMNERAVRLLRGTGSPIAFDDIVEVLRVGDRARSLRNAMLLDDRIVRVDKDLFALEEWGLAAYSTVRDLMRQEIEASGGEAAVADIKGNLTARYDIKASSIDAYARSPDFVRVKPGVIRLRGADEEVEGHERPLHSLRGCVRIGRRWALRVEVTASLLKGFSVLLPSGLARHFGVPQGESAMLRTDRSDEISVVRRGLQDHIGRLRWVAEELGLSEGDVLFVLLPERRGGRISFSGLSHAGIGRAKPRRRAGMLLGQDGDLSLALACSALGMPRSSRAAEVADRLRSRGEDELAALVGEVLGEGTTTGVDTSDIARMLGL